MRGATVKDRTQRDNPGDKEGLTRVQDRPDDWQGTHIFRNSTESVAGVVDEIKRVCARAGSRKADTSSAYLEASVGYLA